TFLSNCVALGYFLIYLRVRGKRTLVTISPRELHPDGAVLRGIFRVEISASIQNLLNVTSNTAMNNFAAAYGAQALAFAIARKLLLELPLLCLFNLLFPLYGIPYAQPASELVLAIAAGVVVFRIFRTTDSRLKK
ncbi:MAG TPA: hypothetical protein H9896_01170, partial [Candidatus Pygmaiobacter gallistercoris]|nr:hypothetical protein [Candidatus Pygmaiobacter gallistercoris]